MVIVVSCFLVKMPHACFFYVFLEQCFDGGAIGHLSGLVQLGWIHSLNGSANTKPAVFLQPEINKWSSTYILSTLYGRLTESIEDKIMK